MRSIAVANQKGGVGKTTTSVNLAVALARQGRRVCLVDLDPQAHATLHLGVMPGSHPLSAFDVLVGGQPLAAAGVTAGDSLCVVPSHIDLSAVEMALAGKPGRESILRQRIAADPRCTGGAAAGFVAATFGRGLACWQVPTTVVAQVDSAIGGKTGINLTAGKNLVGAFWQPHGVIADIDTLATLPAREFVSGFAEVVKYGMILDAAFFSWLEDNVGPLMARDPAALAHAVERSAALKAGVVEQDERELTGLRAVLNYGHTFAHAYETAAGYGTLLHGEAVAIGMARAARLARDLGRVSDDLIARQDQLLLGLGLPVEPPPGVDLPAEALLEVMARDKKAVGGELRFVLPARIGHVELVEGVSTLLVRRALVG